MGGVPAGWPMRGPGIPSPTPGILHVCFHPFRGARDRFAAPALICAEQPFDVAATACRLLTNGLQPLSVDGAALGGGLPSRRIALSELSSILMHPSCGYATLCLTVGFLRYTSGEPGEVERGKLAFRSAAIGYAGALLSPLIVTIVGQWVA